MKINKHLYIITFLLLFSNSIFGEILALEGQILLQLMQV